ncbi:ABC transporter permease [Paenibacillus sp. GCM10027626]|uniref:ABC transporter permease n=1 Tax=Paenibacillus sp. GCM10027626 TaxID=3273411 RepID=UPI003636C78C
MKRKRHAFQADLIRNRWLYLLFLPVLIWYAIFAYWPMYGLMIAFQDYSIVKGIGGSEWVGWKNYETFFGDPYFLRLLRNTILLNVYGLVFGFPVPIVLALLFNEIRGRFFKRISQTISYLPYFISSVVVCGLVIHFLSPSTGLVNAALNKLGFESVYFLQDPNYFRSIFVTMSIWQSAGFSAIIYMAALAGISPELYEAARIDGANRWHQLRFITLPALMPTAVMLLILSMGGMLQSDYEKIILLSNPTIFETADVLNTYVYRKGILETNFSYATAVGLFQGLIGFALVVTANKISRKVSENSLW